MNILLLLGIVLLNVAFLTLLERNLLSFAQIRKGPNLVGPVGCLQPFADGMKLLTNTNYQPLESIFIFWSAPAIFFFLNLFLWGSIIPQSNLALENFFFFILAVSGVGAFFVFLVGWGGGSSYSTLGGVRASAQMISYEVVLSFFLIIPLLFSGNISSLFAHNFFLTNNLFFCFFILSTFITIILAETNRAPFDLTEGESELVSGFNTEYSSVLFVFLFLAEYAAILFLTLFLALLLVGAHSSLVTTTFWMVNVWAVMLLRACFPRNRYDFLIELTWNFFFPLSLGSLALGIFIFLL